MSAEGVLLAVEPYSGADEFIKKVHEFLGDLPDIDVFHNQVVVAKFIRTRVSRSIIAAAPTQLEDKWQGKVGLVVKIGPSAFVDEPGFAFHGIKVEVGDWVIYRNTDGSDMDYMPPGSTEKFHLRWIEDAQIKGRASRPESIW